MNASKFIAVAFCVALGGCGYTGRDGEMIGQAKKVEKVTNIFCPNYYALDVSLGVMQGGTGSMSTRDVWLTIDDIRDLDKMKTAVDIGALIRVRYDRRRFAVCTEDLIATGFEIYTPPAKAQ